MFQHIQREFEGFEQLFNRYLHETGPSVDWENIKLLKDDAVSELIIVYFTQLISSSSP